MAQNVHLKSPITNWTTACKGQETTRVAFDFAAVDIILKLVHVTLGMLAKILPLEVCKLIWIALKTEVRPPVRSEPKFLEKTVSLKEGFGDGGKRGQEREKSNLGSRVKRHDDYLNLGD